MSVNNRNDLQNLLNEKGYVHPESYENASTYKIFGDKNYDTNSKSNIYAVCEAPEVYTEEERVEVDVNSSSNGLIQQDKHQKRLRKEFMEELKQQEMKERKIVTQPSINLKICPVCQEHARYACVCSIGEQVCQQGHMWYFDKSDFTIKVGNPHQA